MYPLREKSRQKGLKVTKYSVKVLPQINQLMGNTGDRLWECRQFLSTQNEQYETHRARGDFPLFNRSRMVSLSRADKKKCKS